MKLIAKPQTTTEYIEISDAISYGMKSWPGRTKIENVKILVEDHGLTNDDIWNTLKYGPMPDLFDAMNTHTKIPKIDFPNDNITLFGVHPVAMERSSIWQGRVFECSIDYFEVHLDEEE